MPSADSDLSPELPGGPEAPGSELVGAGSREPDPAEKDTVETNPVSADSVNATPVSAVPAVVVGIGGSAGALDAYERFFVGLPLGSRMAFVVVSHLSPHAESLMPEILQRCTVLNVQAIRNGLSVEADQVYVTPPGFSVMLEGGALYLRPLEEAQGHTIDTFFRSLAADQGEAAVGVVLSGLGRDGTAGVQAIKAAGGRVLVQDAATAEFPVMPQSAAATGVADAVLDAEALAPRLYNMVNQDLNTRSRLIEAGSLPPEGQSELQRILLLVRSRTGHDFSGYKPSTLVRRIDRRMKSQQIATLAEYRQQLSQTPGEVEGLFEDLTINVTRFFRDPDAFAQLKEHLRSLLLLRGPPQASVRVWVPGCSSGEEAYSVAIILHELMEELGRTLNLQIFATDIDQQSINAARLGLYPPGIAQIVSAPRLERYFQRSEEGYQIQGFVRESVVFALHNTFSDPAFTRLDLLCCRNLLIYLKSEVQQHILAVFHYALNPGALLFLGTSETLGQQRQYFSALDTHWRIYQRGQDVARPLPSGQVVAREGRGAGRPNLPVQATPQRTLSQHAQRVLLAQYAPPAVVVNLQGEILFVNGQTGRYLELPSGAGSPNNVLEMVRPDLRYDLTAALKTVRAEQREVTVRRRRIGGDADTPSLIVDITVRPLHGPEEGLMMLVFREWLTEHVPLLSAPDEQLDQVQGLTRDLQYTRETLQANIEEMLISLEELRSTNEEYQTTIEELKSTNEELMTSKEELQSLNEELITTNSEHQRVITDLAQANDDMNNLLESAGIATLFLGNDFRIKRFTPRFANLIRLLPGDVGRPIGDFSLKLRYGHFLRDLSQVLDTLLPFETQVQTQDDHWYLLRITPYRTASNFIDGVVVTFTDFDTVKHLKARLDGVGRAALLEPSPGPPDSEVSG